jgi:hypothetical protein
MPYNNITNNYQPSLYIVDADGSTPFATIQSAIDQAVLDSGGVPPTTPITIGIRPGTYTENLVLVDSVNLSGYCDTLGTGTAGSYIASVIIEGVHTPPATGKIVFSNLKFATTTDVLFDAAAGSTNIAFYNCLFACDSGYICNIINWTGDITFESCSDISIDNGIFINGSGAAIDIKDSQLGAIGHSLSLTGPTRIFNSRIFCPVTLAGIAPLSAAALIQDSTIDSQLIVANDADVSIYNSYLTETAIECINTSSSVAVKLGNVVINTPALSAIIGAGTINAGELVFMDSSGIAGTITIAGSDTCASSLLRTYGNIDMPATNAAGSTGILYLDATPHYQALGTNNTFVGEEAGNLTLTVANATDEVACGYQSLHHVTSGQYNTAIGSSSLHVTTGSNNIALGYNAGSALVAAESGNIMIGSDGVIGDAATTRIGDAQTSNYQAGIYQASSGAIKEVCYVDNTGKLSTSNLGITQWITATASLTAASNTGYIVKMAIPGLCTITLPALSAVGDVIEITGYTVGGWTIAQGALQQIHFITSSTTLGALGELRSLKRYGSVKIVCVTQNTDWNVISSSGLLIID